MKPSQINLVFVFSLFGLWITVATPAPDSRPSGASRLILLDVDNTLYREKNANVEAQIVEGTHSYCKNVLGMDKEDALKRMEAQLSRRGSGNLDQELLNGAVTGVIENDGVSGDERDGSGLCSTNPASTKLMSGRGFSCFYVFVE